MEITKFFNTDYINFASYDNYRSIASIVDGLKVSARKVIYTIIKHNINTPMKVSICMSKTSETTNYLHGEQSLHGVIVRISTKLCGNK